MKDVKLIMFMLTESVAPILLSPSVKLIAKETCYVITYQAFLVSADTWDARLFS